MTNQDDDIVKVDFAFKRLLAQTVEGDLGELLLSVRRLRR